MKPLFFLSEIAPFPYTIGMTVSAQEIVESLELALANLPPGTTRIEVDGLKASYSIDQAIKQLEFWRQRASKEQGKRPRYSRIRLDG